jgi:hypothetical protein
MPMRVQRATTDDCESLRVQARSCACVSCFGTCDAQNIDILGGFVGHLMWCCAECRGAHYARTYLVNKILHHTYQIHYLHPHSSIAVIRLLGSS